MTTPGKKRITDGKFNFKYKVSSVLQVTCRRGLPQCETTESCYCPWTTSSSVLNLMTAEGTLVSRTEKSIVEFLLGFPYDIHHWPFDSVRVNITAHISCLMSVASLTWWLEKLIHMHRYT